MIDVDASLETQDLSASTSMVFAEGPYALRSQRRLLGRQFILRGGYLQFFEPKLHLLQQPYRAFRTGAIQLAPQLLDLELVVADQRFRAL
ncbi:hypothetical protein ACM41_12345 [Bradyrhizobium sp. CCBAU 21362]|nr:hypothetical protein [Bradyrhizobium sp. CCBAU 21362]